MKTFDNIPDALNAIQRDINMLSTKLRRRATRRAAERTLQWIKDNTVPVASGHLKDTGHLEGSTIVFDAPYALDVERGRLKGTMPPTAAIAAWAAKVGIPDPERYAYVIARKIARDGIQPTWFMAKSLPELERILDQEVRAILAEGV